MNKDQFKIEVLPIRSELLSYAQHILNNSDDAEDVIQEVYIKLWNLRSELNKYKNIKAFSVEITKNICLNQLKLKSRKNENLDIVRSVSQEPSPYLALEQKDSIEQIIRILDKLPDLQQAILKMKHIEGFEIDEIAEIIGSNTEAVRMNLSRARKKVREIFFKI